VPGILRAAEKRNIPYRYHTVTIPNLSDDVRLLAYIDLPRIFHSLVRSSDAHEAAMGSLLPFRDINVHASASHYAFTSPSTPSAPTLVVERPTGDLRLNDGALLGAKRVSSIAGILGIVKLKLGEEAISFPIGIQ
jgi:hypothetical protein